MKTLKERFEEKFVKSEGCWNWTANASGEGYGRFFVDGRRRPAHRISYELYKGNIPAGMLIMHSCDNRLCVNPAHLSPGTIQDNTADRTAKNRMPSGDRHPKTRITDAQVAAIRADSRPNKVVAKVYGIFYKYVQKIRSGERRRQGIPMEYACAISPNSRPITIARKHSESYTLGNLFVVGVARIVVST